MSITIDIVHTVDRGPILVDPEGASREARGVSGGTKFAKETSLENCFPVPIYERGARHDENSGSARSDRQKSQRANQSGHPASRQ
jgi:hypothetical protein